MSSQSDRELFLSFLEILEEYKRLRKEYEVCCYVQAAKDIDKRFY